MTDKKTEAQTGSSKVDSVLLSPTHSPEPLHQTVPASPSLIVPIPWMTVIKLTGSLCSLRRGHPSQVPCAPAASYSSLSPWLILHMPPSALYGRPTQSRKVHPSVDCACHSTAVGWYLLPQASGLGSDRSHGPSAGGKGHMTHLS